MCIFGSFMYIRYLIFIVLIFVSKSDSKSYKYPSSSSSVPMVKVIIFGEKVKSPSSVFRFVKEVPNGHLRLEGLVLPLLLLLLLILILILISVIIATFLLGIRVILLLNVRHDDRGLEVCIRGLHLRGHFVILDDVRRTRSPPERSILWSCLRHIQ